MDSLLSPTASKTTQPVPFLVRLITMVDMVLWLIGFFTLTQEDQSAMGIHTDVKMRDE